jgi:hypothetical protein
MDSWRLDGTWSVNSPAEGNRVVLLEAQGARRSRVVAWGYRGPTLPAKLVDARLEYDAKGYRLSWGSGQATFEARWLDRQLSLPELFAPLHAQFRLQGRDRWVVRLLMGLLRLPGGERLLRGWHTRRR